MLGFQTSQASTGNEAKFTINLMVIGKAAWEEARATYSYYSAKPSPEHGRPASVSAACGLPESRSGPLVETRRRRQQ
ncbi:hypothetical protein IDVR_37670 [Intrasporangium sp. DVR]